MVSLIDVFVPTTQTACMSIILWIHREVVIIPNVHCVKDYLMCADITTIVDGSFKLFIVESETTWPKFITPRIYKRICNCSSAPAHINVLIRCGRFRAIVS